MTAPEKTYLLLEDGAAIQCIVCGRTSHHPMDVKERYCGHCKRWHEGRASAPLLPFLSDPEESARNFGELLALHLGRPATADELAELSRWHQTVACATLGLAAAAADKAAQEAAEARRRAADVHVAGAGE